MNVREILNAMDIVEEDLLLEVDHLRTRKKSVFNWIAVAACLCLLCCGAWMLALLPEASESQPTEKAFNTEPIFEASASQIPTEEVKLFEPYYNEATASVSGSLREDVCLFSQQLNEAETLSFTPHRKPDWMELSGYAVFTGDGALRQVVLLATTNLPDVSVKITLATQKTFSDVVLPDEPRVSLWNSIKFTLWRTLCPDESSELFAQATINECFCTFSLHGTQETSAQNEADFAMVLQTFAEADFGLDALSAIRAQEIPVMYDKKVTHEEALGIEPFGKYFLPTIPDGFQEESIRRYLDRYDAHLSGLWTKGYDELYWKVSTLTEADKNRLTHAEDTERYDLSRYPIPRADSVPESLREVVDNPIFFADELTSGLIWSRAYKTDEQVESNGWRLAFSVVFGETVIEVRCKGVDPDWIYQQLSGFPLDTSSR